jgi:hypothetical protein
LQLDLTAGFAKFMWFCGEAAEKQAWSVVSHSSIEASMWFGPPIR